MKLWLYKDREEEAKLSAIKLQRFISMIYAKYSPDVANEQTVSTIELPNNWMKGRIIGREGKKY